MRFGPVALSEAEGAILAHSVAPAPVGGGKPYKIAKGTVLDARHLADLAASGVAQVWVARLDAGDLHEDAAAAQLAAALVADNSGLIVEKPTTGRVNLRAGGAGIVELDAGAIHAANRINPAITIATVAPWKRLEPRGLAVTVKIIPFGVDAGDLARACDAARGAIRLRSPQVASASLIETRVGAGAPSDVLPDKGRKAIQTRLGRFDVGLSERCVVAHDPADIAGALRAATGELLLILTGSATSDIRDTAPQAVVDAGGEITCYGMPVDPGNLLFIGRLGVKCVIGLPGCARSIAMNGADWVLERVICGLPVGAGDIAAMGVGGLLKEIPSRPMPRAGIKR